MFLIYTQRKTNRLKYIFDILLSQILGLEIGYTNEKEVFVNYKGYKINYSSSSFGDEIFFASDKLLFEHGIFQKELSFIKFHDLPAFFPVHQRNAAFPFDVFAASFYLVTRFEEYLPFKKDQYGRFNAKESIAYKYDFLHKPIVNIWAEEIRNIIKLKYPQCIFKQSKYKYISTIDIDAAWSFKGKGFFRTVGSYLKSLYYLDFENFALRTKVLLALANDPFDTFDFIYSSHKKYHYELIYFILFADYGHNDKNISVFNTKFQTLIKSLGDYSRVGIHPSYNSNFQLAKLKTEINRLSKVLNREILYSRQHFLKLEFPFTYRNLINMNISDDFSMGYAGMPGFRAGICTPFRFYDLDLDIVTKLCIHPFSFMEVTLKDYMNLTLEEATQIVFNLIAEVKKVNGEFISLWHNESLSDKGKWRGWKSLYEKMLIEAQA